MVLATPLLRETCCLRAHFGLLPIEIRRVDRSVDIAATSLGDETAIASHTCDCSRTRNKESRSPECWSSAGCSREHICAAPLRQLGDRSALPRAWMRLRGAPLQPCGAIKLLEIFGRSGGSPSRTVR